MLGSPRWVRRFVSTQVRSGSPTAASRNPRQTRRRGSAPGRRVREVVAAAPSSARLITWTSRPTPESRMTRLITEPRVSSAKRERRVAPRTIWVALRVCAAATSASPMSAPTTSRYVPPSSSTSSRCLVKPIGRAAREAVLGTHVDGEEIALRPRRHARRAAHEALAVGGARQRDDDPLARLPGPVDAVALAVVLQRVVDAVGDPEERELAQRAEVPRAEVVAERGVDALGRIDVPVRHPAPDRLRRHVHELDLVGPADDRVGDRLLLLDPGDLLDDVVDRLEVLDVEGRDHRDAGVEQRLDVLPALLVLRAGDVRVRQLVDERHLGPAGEDRVDVHLLERRAAVVDASCAARPRGRRPARRSSGGRASRRSRRRRPCLARPGGAPRPASRMSCRRRARHRGRCGASRGPWTKSDSSYLPAWDDFGRAPGSARARSRRARRGSRASGRRCARTRGRARRESARSRSLATRAAWIFASAGEMCGSSPDPDDVTASTGTGAPGASPFSRR